MKILHIDSEKGFGGGQRQLLFLMRSLKENNFSQILCARPDSQIGQKALDLGIIIENLKQKNDLDVLSAISLGKICSRFKPDIIHTHTSRALSISYLARLIKRIKKPPLIVNTRRVAFPLSGTFTKEKYLKEQIIT